MKSTLKARYGNGLRNEKRKKKTKEPLSDIGKMKQASTVEIKVGIPYKWISVSKARNRLKIYRN